MIGDRINFIEWLINRLIYKHHYAENDSIIESLADIKYILKYKPAIDINDQCLDKIISKYYVDFYLDKCEDMTIGFTDDERKSLRQSIKNIVNDILGTLY